MEYWAQHIVNLNIQCIPILTESHLRARAIQDLQYAGVAISYQMRPLLFPVIYLT